MYDRHNFKFDNRNNIPLKLNYKQFGSGDPIIILHGLFGMLDNWQTIAKRLASDYMVYIVDLRDHGKSEHSNDFNYQLLAQDIADFMESEWIHSAHIIGHSMGGKTAIQLVYDYPDLVEKLIVVDIGIKAYKGGHEIILKALQAVPIDNITSRDAVEEVLSEYVPERGIRLFLMKNLTRNKDSSYRWKMNLDLLINSYSKILAEIPIVDPIDTPTLFVKGSKSKYIVDQDVPQLEAVFTDMSLVTIADAGHWVHAEQPSELLSTIKSFINK